MTDIATKYSMLDKDLQKEANDFMDFLLNKKHIKQNSDLSEYKKKILKISVWSEEDIEVFDANSRLLNDLEIEKW